MVSTHCIRMSVLLVVIGVVAIGCDSDKPMKHPESTAGITFDSSASLPASDRAKLRRSISPLLRAWQTKVHAAGAQLALTDGTSTIEFASGQASRKPARNMTIDDQLRIASASKTLVAAVALQLVEEDTVSLDETIDPWFPNLPQSDHITIRMLLNHTSGVPDYLESDAFDTIPEGPNHPWPHRGAVTAASSMDRAFAPGDAHEYSNTNYHLLGLIIESETGMSLHHEIQERLLSPLHLGASTLDAGRGPHQTTTRGYDADGVDVSNSAYGPSSAWRTAGWADGPAIMTAEDLATWGYDLLATSEVLQSETRTAMTTPALRTEDGNGLGIFGDDPVRNGHYTALSHSGGDIGFESLVIYYPDLEVSVAVIINSETSDDAPAPNSLTRRAAELYAQQTR